MRLVVTLLCLSFAAPVASAQESGDEQRARALFVEAREAFDAGRFPEAREKLEESLELAPRPATAMNLSRVLRSMGELLTAEVTLEALLGGEFGVVESERGDEARSLLEEVRGEIGTINVSIRGADDAEVRVDGVPAGRGSPGAPLAVRVDPGDHVVVATADGGRAERSLTIGPAEEQDVPLTIELDDDVVEEDDGSVFSSPWFWIITGVLVAGGVAAAIVVATRDRTAEPMTDPVFGLAEVLRGP